MELQVATRLARWKPAVAGCGVALLAVACGSGGGTPAGTPSPSSGSAPASSAARASSTAPASPVLCQNAAALRTSLHKLGHVTEGAGAQSQLMANIAAVKADLKTFAASARGQWQAQTGALKSALATLQAAVKALAASPGTSAVGVVTALGDVSTAAKQLFTAVNTRCPHETTQGAGQVRRSRPLTVR
jgi:hypothetical protein